MTKHTATSECRWRTGAYYFALNRANALESMGAAAFEVIGVSRPKNFALAIDGYFKATGQYDAAFLTFMSEGDLAGICTWRVTLPQNLKGPPEKIVTDLPVRDLSLSDLDQFVRLVEDLLRCLGLERKELGHSDRNPIEYALKRAD